MAALLSLSSEGQRPTRKTLIGIFGKRGAVSLQGGKGRQIKCCLSCVIEGIACVESSQMLSTVGEFLGETPESFTENLELVLGFKG